MALVLAGVLLVTVLAVTAVGFLYREMRRDLHDLFEMGRPRLSGGYELPRRGDAAERTGPDRIYAPDLVVGEVLGDDRREFS